MTIYIYHNTSVIRYIHSKLWIFTPGLTNKLIFYNLFCHWFMTHEDCIIRLTTWHWTTCLGAFIWKTWLDLSGCVRPPAVGAWLTSSVTPPVVFCHLCSLTRESKCGRQVFSQHMILKIAVVALRKRSRNSRLRLLTLDFEGWLDGFSRK